MFKVVYITIIIGSILSINKIDKQNFPEKIIKKSKYNFEKEINKNTYDFIFFKELKIENLIKSNKIFNNSKRIFYHAK